MKDKRISTIPPEMVEWLDKEFEKMMLWGPPTIKKCPDCGEDLIRVPTGLGTMYVEDQLYCDLCDKYFTLDFDK